MASKKRYDELNLIDDRREELENTIQTGSSSRRGQSEVTPEEELQRLSTLRTRGRKGVKAPRNMILFTPDNYEYLKVASSMRGLSISRYVNNVIEETRRKDIAFNELQAIMKRAEGRQDE